MALQGKEYAIVAVPAPGVADSSPWNWPIQGLELANPGAGNGQRRGWDSDKEALIERQWSLRWPTMEH